MGDHTASSEQHSKAEMGFSSCRAEPELGGASDLGTGPWPKAALLVLLLMGTQPVLTDSVTPPAIYSNVFGAPLPWESWGCPA